MVYITDMPYMSSKNRHRYQFIENAMISFEDFLDRNDVEDGFIEAEQSRVYRELLNNLAIPNVRSGVLQLGKNAIKSSGYIPIWALDSNEPFGIAYAHTLPSPQQMTIVEEWLKAPKEILFSSIKRNPERSSLGARIMPEVVAMVGGSISPLPDTNDGNTGLVAFGRPHYLMNSLAPEYSGRVDIMAHELQHVYQSMYRPVSKLLTNGDFDDLILADEIEAHYHQVTALHEMCRQGLIDEEAEDPTIDAAVRIVNITEAVLSQEDNSTDKLTQIRKELADVGLQCIAGAYSPEDTRHHSIYT